jgi:hypothetical protein
VAVVQYTFTHSTQNAENGIYITIRRKKNWELYILYNKNLCWTVKLHIFLNFDEDNGDASLENWELINSVAHKHSTTPYSIRETASIQSFRHVDLTACIGCGASAPVESHFA